MISKHAQGYRQINGEPLTFMEKLEKVLGFTLFFALVASLMTGLFGIFIWLPLLAFGALKVGMLK